MFSSVYQKKLTSYKHNSFPNPDIEPTIKKNTHTIHDLPYLLSPDAIPFLPQLAARARTVTHQRFGKIIQFYAPLYLSNECESLCVYCGFSHNRQVPRISLTLPEIEKNMVFLHKKGFQNILLLTGEAPKKFGVESIRQAVHIAKKYFPFVGIEVFPMEENDYISLVKAGADGITIYQETYDPALYSKMHLQGPKKDFFYRLDTPDRALKAGFRKIGLGALMGLGNPFFEVIMLAQHIEYLRKKYWRSEITISFPRIRPENIISKVPYPVSDRDIVQIVCALRLCYPDLGFILSTRETPEFRDHLLDIGITQMSAESKTSPGGYTLNGKGEQFAVSDERTLEKLIETVKSKGYDPVLKDWSHQFEGVKYS